MVTPDLSSLTNQKLFLRPEKLIVEDIVLKTANWLKSYPSGEHELRLSPKLQKSQLLPNSYKNSCRILSENSFLESNSFKNLARFAFFCSECYQKCINPTIFLHFLPQKS